MPGQTDDKKMAVGLAVYALRKFTSHSQKKFGRKVGVNDKTVSGWETGKNHPKLESIKRVLEFAGSVGAIHHPAISVLISAAPELLTVAEGLIDAHKKSSDNESDKIDVTTNLDAEPVYVKDTSKEDFDKETISEVVIPDKDPV